MKVVMVHKFFMPDMLISRDQESSVDYIYYVIKSYESIFLVVKGVRNQ